MNYYQIIPLTRISLKAQPFFTYACEKDISNGSLVEIEFGRKKIKGVVYKKTNRPPFATKKISRIIEKNVIQEQQINLAKKISSYYFSSLGVVLKLFIPRITKKKIPLTKNNSKKIKKNTLTSAQKKSVEKIISSKNKKSLLFGPASSGKTEVLMEVSEKLINKNKQVLIVIPEIFLSYQEIERYQERFQKKGVALIHSKIKASAFFSIWNNVKNGKIKLIIATKIGVFLPFRNLGLVAIDEEQDISHKHWDQTPRYHIREVSEWLADLHKSRLIYSSATPSLEILKSKKDLVQLPSLKTKNINVKKPQIELIDLRKYFFNQKASLNITPPLKKSIEEKLKEKKLSIVLVPRRGKSQAIICTDCKKIIQCPTCKIPLVHIADNYRCLHCNYKISSLSQCPQCRSFRLKNIGFGTEKISEELKTIFPKAIISTADQTSFQKNPAREKLFQAIKDKKIDILVGTQSVIKGFDFPQTELAVIINSEKWGGKTDFRFDERWLGNLFQLAGRVNRPRSSQKGKLIIQTFHPENTLIKHLETWKWNVFVEQEMKNREALKYPPTCHLVKLIYSNENFKKVEKNVKTVYNQVLKIKSQQIIEVLAPYAGNMKKRRNKWQKNILIKTTDLENASLKKIIEKLSPNWIIDVNPENIF